MVRQVGVEGMECNREYELVYGSLSGGCALVALELNSAAFCTSLSTK